jgi:hypothetical protein
MPHQIKPLTTKQTAAHSAAPRQTFAIRELSKLIADIRRSRAQFEPVEAAEQPVQMELVVGADPRD